MPASIAATSSGSSGLPQSMPATSPAKTGCRALIDTGMSSLPLLSALRPSRRRFAPPQDEDKTLMELRKDLILRSPHSGRLEGRATLIQQPRTSSRPPVAERVLAQEIEIAAAVGLEDLAAVEPGIAALGHRRRGGLAARQLVGRDQEVDPALLDRKADAVAVLHLGERPTARRIRRHVQHDRTIGGAAHPRVRDAHHVLNPGARELRRDRQIAGL